MRPRIMPPRRGVRRDTLVCAALCAFAIAIIPVVPIAAHAQPSEGASATAANPLPDVDKAFVQAASMASSTAFDASKLAMEQSYDYAVKSYARRMLFYHLKMTLQLKMATPHNVSVPIDNSDISVMNSLKGLQGKAFDKTYIEAIALDGHRKAIAAFQNEIQNGQNARLRKLAAKVLPTLQMHYELAQSLAKETGIAAP